MNKQELIKLCLKLDDAIETHPFGEDENIVLRHKSNNKWFALVFHLNKKLCVNLKSRPEDSVFLRDFNKGVLPAWHMNKTHWNTVEVNNVEKDLLESMIKASFDLTASKNRRGKNEK